MSLSEPEEVAVREKKLVNPWVVVVSVVLAAVIVLALVAYFTALGPGLPIRILGVSISPENPGPGEKVTVTANVEGGSSFSRVSVDLSYESYFASGSGGGGTMRPAGDNRYQAEMGPFPDGAEVWFIVSAATPSEGPIFSEHFTLQIGEVLRGGPSGLRLERVAHSPAEPRPLDDVVVTARVVSMANITEVSLLYATFTRQGSGSGGGSMFSEDDANFTTPIMVGGSGEWGYERGTIYFYRVAAMDETGNTAVSEVYSFTIA